MKFGLAFASSVGTEPESATGPGGLDRLAEFGERVVRPHGG